MTAEEVLKSNEDKALSGGQFISSVAGKGKGKMKGGKKAAAIGAGVFIVGMLAIPMFIFGFGNFAPVALSERLVEETDVQHPDAVRSTQLVFQQALSQGDVPENTNARLKENGVLVGTIDESGNFVEDAKGTYVKVGDKVVSANDFYNEANKNVDLYNALNNATYDRAAYWYDGRAEDTFYDMGITRNSTSGDSEFEETMAGVMGEGSDVTINGVGPGKCTKTDENGNAVVDEDGNAVIVDCQKNGSANSKDTAEEFINNVGINSMDDSSSDQTTMNAASSLETGETSTRQLRSSKFFMGVMENISKMKAGEGSDAQLNGAMNYLYQEEESQVVDVETGEVITVKGSAMQSPSLFAILSGEGVDPETVKNYSTERITNTVQNRINNGDYNINESYTNTATSSNLKSSDIGRYVYYDGVSADSEALQKTKDTVDSSMVNNSFKTIKGVAAGEMLVEGAVNVGASLALNSGATAGDASSVNEYARLTKDVLAMDAAADRLNRSPLDITSKNTFLGALVRKFAVETIRSGSFLNQVASFAKVTASAVNSLISIVSADEENASYMKPYDGCKRFKNIGASAASGCLRNETFDTTTLESNIFNSQNFKNFLENNVDEATGRPKDNSHLAKFILYNQKRQTPLGVTDAGILDSLENVGTGDGSSKIPFLSDIFTKIGSWLSSLFTNKDTENNRIATGAAFVNSSENSDWENYKYAQRWVSLTRAKEALRRYDGGENAYVNIPWLGGKEDPVMAFIKEYKESQNSIAAND